MTTGSECDLDELLEKATTTAHLILGEAVNAQGTSRCLHRHVVATIVFLARRRLSGDVESQTWWVSASVLTFIAAPSLGSQLEDCMGLLDRLFRSRAQQDTGVDRSVPGSTSHYIDRPCGPWGWAMPDDALVLKTGSRLDVVGESHYQDSLEYAARHRSEGAQYIACVAELVPDPNNEFDRNAVRIEIAGRPVGHLSRDQAQVWQPFLLPIASAGRRIFTRATIAGGWDRGPADSGSWGVRLDMAKTPDDATPKRRVKLQGWAKDELGRMRFGTTEWCLEGDQVVRCEP